MLFKKLTVVIIILALTSHVNYAIEDIEITENQEPLIRSQPMSWGRRCCICLQQPFCLQFSSLLLLINESFLGYKTIANFIEPTTGTDHLSDIAVTGINTVTLITVWLHAVATSKKQ